MIVLDIETSGGEVERCGIIQIGAINLEDSENTFLDDARLNEEYDIVQAINIGPNSKTVEEVNGLTEEQMRDEKKQSEKELLEKFFEWIKKVKVRNFICHNPQFDYSFVYFKARKYGLKIPFYHRTMDLSTIAQVKNLDINGEFLINENRNDMGLKNILRMCGMEDNREAHNALEDAKLTAECFSRLMFGKNLFPEFAEFEIPKELRK